MLQRKKKAWQLSDQYVLLEQGVVNEVDSVYCSEMTRKQTGLCVGFCLKVPTVILGRIALQVVCHHLTDGGGITNLLSHLCTCSIQKNTQARGSVGYPIWVDIPYGMVHLGCVQFYTINDIISLSMGRKECTTTLFPASVMEAGWVKNSVRIHPCLLYRQEPRKSVPLHSFLRW